MTWITTAIRKAGLEPASSERLGLAGSREVVVGRRVRPNNSG